MPPLRVFYDTDNPRMYSEEEIDALSPAEAKAACDQIDQNMIGVLQRIDEAFVKANEIVASQILPTVEQYGENSQLVWESIKFWKYFFEASANTRLSGYDEEEVEEEEEGEVEEEVGEEYEEQEIEDEDTAQLEAQITQNIEHNGDEDEKDATPRPPGDQRKNADTTPSDVPSVPSPYLRDPSRDNPGGGPSPVPSLPEFETVNVGGLIQDTQGTVAETPELPVAATPRAYKRTIDAFGTPRNTTPRRRNSGKGAGTPRAFPEDIPRNWDGVTDLGKTPLSAFRFDDDDDVPNPPTISVLRSASKGKRASLAVPSPARLKGSPGKLRSPGGLPSITLSPAPKRRTTENVVRAMVASTSNSSSSKPPVTLKNPSPRKKTLEDFLDTGFTQNLEDLLENDTLFKVSDATAQLSFSNIVDDDKTLDKASDDDRTSERDSGVIQEEDVYDENGITRDLGRINIQGPEDTLFGLGNQKANDQQEFKVKGLSDIHTLHGGELLESQPFVPSPLAGRDRRER